MKYRILSVRIGKPGTLFVPPAGTNVQALVKARLIEPVPDKKPDPDETKNVKKDAS